MLWLNRRSWAIRNADIGNSTDVVIYSIVKIRCMNMVFGVCHDSSVLLEDSKKILINTEQPDN